MFSVRPPKKSWKNISNLSGEVICHERELGFIIQNRSSAQFKSCRYLLVAQLGGEKTLSSLALVFALHHYLPTALYVMDEIDAALVSEGNLKIPRVSLSYYHLLRMLSASQDFKNVSIVANYIKDRTKDAQFIIISLRWSVRCSFYFVYEFLRSQHF